MLNRPELPRLPLECAKHYRSRAEQLRIIANEWADSGMGEILKRVAENYEPRAERIEKQARVSERGTSPAGAPLSAA